MIEQILIGACLAMDAAAVSVALGAVEHRNFTVPKMLLTSLMFGLSQFFMPVVGWLGGSLVGSIVQSVGHWVACALLLFLGGKMIKDAFSPEEDVSDKTRFGLIPVLVMAFATSIDALLIGVYYVCMGEDHVYFNATIIGLVTFVISLVACVLGRLGGAVLGNKCNILGGLVLIGIGLKALFA